MAGNIFTREREKALRAIPRNLDEHIGSQIARAECIVIVQQAIAEIIATQFGAAGKRLGAQISQIWNWEMLLKLMIRLKRVRSLSEAEKLIVKTAMKTKTIEFEANKIQFRLVRLNDDRYEKLHRKTLSIEEDTWFQHLLEQYLEERGEDLKFAQIYVTLKFLTGESGQCFDDWKGSFSFPFLLEVKKRNGQFSYLLNIYNFRSMLCFSLRRFLSSTDDRRNKYVVHPPFANEFSRKEINAFIAGFYGYLIGFFRVIKKIHKEFFFQRVDSNGILFGYKAGKFFQKYYESESRYEKAVKALEKLKSKSRRRNDLKPQIVPTT